MCRIDWTTTPARVLDPISEQLTDEVLLALINSPSVARVAIDAPFGWPLAFIDTIGTYRDTGYWLPLAHEEVRFRATEVRVSAETGQAPLSVATSDLAWPAMRCARLLSRCTAGERLDRSGGGRLVEVYPAAALRRWGIIPEGTSVTAAAYKGDKPGRRERRELMMDALLTALNGTLVVPGTVAEACAKDDDDLDALVSALVARAVDVGACDPVPKGMHWVATREGWIHLPHADSLTRLT